MGIPKFYRWLSERYPLLNQKLTLTEGPPEIDNLYLDMNGIIHNCTHANRTNIGGVTEEDMMLKVFDYLDKLVQIVRPQKLLFMAIDGVAPRAKMNQQRSRRFKSAMERLKNEEEQRRKGEVVPEDAFDSNCITPGTEFMARLGKHLRFFIRRKMADDPLWQKPNVVFSGHEVPGEGEHKIMEYIRWEKRQPSYQPNQRHCMYGLDADLIMLSLVTHEPHFCLLREVVSYTGQNRGQPAREVLDNPCAENFIMFQIGLLREYFELEFGCIKLPFPLDLERIVDDYVLMCMLVGNDFLPALPTLDIAEGALNKLMDLYKEVLPSLGGYLTYAGELDRRRLEVLVGRLGQMELATLEERAQDAEFMENKRAKRAARMGGGGGGGSGARGTPQGSHMQLDQVDAGLRSLALSRDPTHGDLLNAPLEPGDEGGGAGPGPGSGAVQSGPTMMSREARAMMMSGLGAEGLQMWKDRYYNEKLHARTAAERRQVVEHYIAGLHWVLEYYYRGVASWDWYYPYHYAPMASDMVNLDSIQVAFAQGTPFRPFEQLLAVLPAASCKLLPPAFRVLMTEPESPIIDFYPGSFDVDMEGKRADWEGVVLVPFVDEARLLKAVASIRSTLLSAEEQARNKMGSIQIFQFARGTAEPSYCKSTMPKLFKDLQTCNSRCLERPPPPPLPAGGKGFTPQLVAGTRIGLNTPQGMPTLKSLQVRPQMRNAGVNVLGTPSRKESLILGLKDLREALGGAVLSAEQVAKSGLLGSRAYINWPYLQEARVVRVSDRAGQAFYDTKGAIKVQKWQQHEAQRWETDAGMLTSTFLTKFGIDVGRVDLVVGVKVCLGYVRHSDGTIEKTYAKEEQQVPLQAVIRQRPQQAAANAAGAAAAASADDTPSFPDLHEGSQVVFLGKHHYGCMAVVLSDLGKSLAVKPAGKGKGAAASNGHYRILVQPITDAMGQQALRSAKRVVERFAVKYYTSSDVAHRVGVTPRLLGRITGNMWARDGDDRYDLGLAIKTSSRDVCVPGFSQPTEDGNGWTYSAAVITILQEYRKKYDWLWAYLIKTENEGLGDIRLDQVLAGLSPTQRKDKVRELTEWIKSTPLAKRPLVKLGVQILADEGVKVLQTTVTPVPARPPPAAEYENVPPALLLPPYTPGPDTVKLAVQGGPFELGDRVVCVSSKGSPPYGSRGTIIGVYEEACEVVFDEEFGGGSNLGGRVNGKCGAFVPKDLLLGVNKAADIHLQKHEMPRQQQPAKQPKAEQASAGGGKGGQKGAPASPANVNCVPASVAPSAPAAPPAPSSKLLGAAMRTASGQLPAAGTATAPSASDAGGGAGKALLEKLTAGSRSSSADNGAAAAQAVAGDKPAGAVGSLAALKQLVPNARVGQPTGQSPTAPPPPPPQPQGPPQAMPPPHMMPPPPPPQYGPPPPGMYPPPHPGAMLPPHGMMPPHPGAPYGPQGPYGPPPPGVYGYPPYGPPMGGPMGPPMGPPMGMPMPMGPGPMGPPGMMMPPPGMPYGAMPPPHMMAPPPHIAPGPQSPRPPAPAPPPPPPPAQLPQQAPGAAAQQQPQQEQQQKQARGKGGRTPQNGNTAQQPQAQQSKGGKKSGGGAQPSGVEAEPTQQPTAADTPAPTAAASGSATPAPPPAAPPAPKSHPIDFNSPMQSFDEGDETVSAMMARIKSNGAAQTSRTGAAAARQGGSHGASPVRQHGTESAKLPEADGKGFRGRGKPTLPPSGAGAPGTPPAPGSAADFGRHSLDGIQAGAALLRSLQAPGAASASASNPGPPAPAAAPSAAAAAAAPAPPPPNPGAALLMKLQGAAAAEAAKAQSLDSGADLLRMLKQGQKE
ncbi:hypothetical protein HYH02_007176 [Chlamydomonas schloesseri]|uniref:Uncharacterized protein n=1 Tax=Chlamydomonas schloesseri TaxID=2026947 RepID=A0A835WHV8_9CHLO|nr:hypothetical protein HYH02_007176 [Chlamydomonas schloesseri]|eukprot:KAG2447716.1 hypothetical protein HYH02_007176 [Chlamydomonas schloesseri]